MPTTTAIPIIGRLLLGALLVGAAALSWSASTIADDLAWRHERLATLRPGADGPAVPRAGAQPSWRRPIEHALDGDVAQHEAVDEYWRRQYDTLTGTAGDTPDDPASLLIAANAAFRHAQREAGARPVAAERLDHSLQAYASVLRNGGFSHDAAYNFEYVVLIAPSQGVHTFGMRFPIDIVGVSRDGTVVKWRSAVGPRRLVFAFSAFAMLEVASGAGADVGLTVGDRLIAARTDDPITR